jgi:hypothetical protein
LDNLRDTQWFTVTATTTTGKDSHPSTLFFRWIGHVQLEYSVGLCFGLVCMPTNNPAQGKKKKKAEVNMTLLDDSRNRPF